MQSGRAWTEFFNLTHVFMKKIIHLCVGKLYAFLREKKKPPPPYDFRGCCGKVMMNSAVVVSGRCYDPCLRHTVTVDFLVRPLPRKKQLLRQRCQDVLAIDLLTKLIVNRSMVLALSAVAYDSNNYYYILNLLFLLLPIPVDGRRPITIKGQYNQQRYYQVGGKKK